MTMMVTPQQSVQPPSSPEEEAHARLELLSNTAMLKKVMDKKLSSWKQHQQHRLQTSSKRQVSLDEEDCDEVRKNLTVPKAPTNTNHNGASLAEGTNVVVHATTSSNTASVEAAASTPKRQGFSQKPVTASYFADEKNSSTPKTPTSSSPLASPSQKPMLLAPPVFTTNPPPVTGTRSNGTTPTTNPISTSGSSSNLMGMGSSGFVPGTSYSTLLLPAGIHAPAPTVGAPPCAAAPRTGFAAHAPPPRSCSMNDLHHHHAMAAAAAAQRQFHASLAAQLAQLPPNVKAAMAYMDALANTQHQQQQMQYAGASAVGGPSSAFSSLQRLTENVPPPPVSSPASRLSSPHHPMQSASQSSGEEASNTTTSPMVTAATSATKTCMPSYETLLQENLRLKKEMEQKDKAIGSLQNKADSLEKQIGELRQLPTGKISHIPIEDMIRIMQEYGSEVSNQTLPKRKQPIQKASIVRQFRRWNPEFFRYFVHVNGEWVPRLGREGELKRRVEKRRSVQKNKREGDTSPDDSSKCSSKN